MLTFAFAGFGIAFSGGFAGDFHVAFQRDEFLVERLGDAFEFLDFGDDFLRRAVASDDGFDLRLHGVALHFDFVYPVHQHLEFTFERVGIALQSLAGDVFVLGGSLRAFPFLPDGGGLTVHLFHVFVNGEDLLVGEVLFSAGFDEFAAGHKAEGRGGDDGEEGDGEKNFHA